MLAALIVSSLSVVSRCPGSSVTNHRLAEDIPLGARETFRDAASNVRFPCPLMDANVFDPMMGRFHRTPTEGHFYVRAEHETNAEDAGSRALCLCVFRIIPPE